MRDGRTSLTTGEAVVIIRRVRPLDRKNEPKETATMSSAETSPITVDFLSRFTASEQFDKVFREGMGLVEETANYLDGPGRQDARLLDRHGAVAYATESMRLTTRLMQLASWLLLQRAVGAGEMNQDEVRKEKHRISLADIGRGNAAERAPSSCPPPCSTSSSARCRCTSAS